MINYSDDVPIPTPTPAPTYTIPDGMQMETDWIESVGHDWASQAIQWWRVIPIDFRTGIQIAILFGIFLIAFSAFIRRLRTDDDGGKS